MATIDTIATRLQAGRARADHTRGTLGDLAGVSIAMIGAVERGDRIPGWRVLARLERALGLRHGDLTRGLDPAA